MEYGEYQPQKVTEVTSVPRYEMDGSVHKWLFDPDTVLREIEKTLRGVVYDKTTKTYKQTYTKHTKIIVR